MSINTCPLKQGTPYNSVRCTSYDVFTHLFTYQHSDLTAGPRDLKY